MISAGPGSRPGRTPVVPCRARSLWRLEWISMDLRKHLPCSARGRAPDARLWTRTVHPEIPPDPGRSFRGRILTWNGPGAVWISRPASRGERPVCSGDESGNRPGLELLGSSLREQGRLGLAGLTGPPSASGRIIPKHSTTWATCSPELMRPQAALAAFDEALQLNWLSSRPPEPGNGPAGPGPGGEALASCREAPPRSRRPRGAS